uniref:Uncharacterized protein n=1 Tax=Alexandrium monilatum TaxID=311494 RepID=A0A7S4SRY7_9DINO
MASWQDTLAAQAARIWSFGTVNKPPLPEAARELDPQFLKEVVQRVTGGEGRFSRVPLYQHANAAAAAAAEAEDEEREEVAFPADETQPAAPRPRRAADALLFEPFQGAGPRCAVVYCPSGRGMPASVSEVISLAKRFLPLNVAVLALDPTADGRAACRLRDVEAALELLRGADGAGGLGYDRVALWGRSAGAATALRYAVKVPALVAIVCDSPRCDLEPLGPPLGAPQTLSVLEWLAATAPSTCGGAGQGSLPLNDAGGDGAAAALARAELREELALPPSVAVERCFVPALFIHGRQDTLAPPSRAQALREAYRGEREPVLWVSGGSHDSRRPAATFAKAALFLLRQFCLDERPELREVVERLAAAAASTQEALPMSPQLMASETEVCRLLGSSNQEDKRRGLLLAALAACPSHRSASFSQVSLPVRGSHEEPLLQSAAMVTLPRPDSEAVAAWATDSSRGGGAVYFAVLSTTLVTLTAVQLLPARGGEAGAEGAVAGLAASVQPLAIAEASLGHGLAPHRVELGMSHGGAVELTFGDAHLAATVDGSPARDGSICGASLWRGVQAAHGDAPTPMLEFLPFGGDVSMRRPQLPRVCRQPAAPLGTRALSPCSMRSLITASSFLTPRRSSLSLTLTEAPSVRSCRTAHGNLSPVLSPMRRPSPAASPAQPAGGARDISPKALAPPPSPRNEQPPSPPESPTATADSVVWATAAEGEFPADLLAALGLAGGEEAVHPAEELVLLGQALTWGPGHCFAPSEVPLHAATWGAPGDL